MAKQNNEKHKYKVVFYDEATLREVKTWSATTTDVIAVIGVVVLLLAVIVGGIVIYSPLNKLLPRQEDGKYRDELVSSALKMDSIQSVLNERNEYFASIRNIMDGKLDVDLSNSDSLLDRKQVDFTKSKHDSILRTLIELEEQQTIAEISGEGKKKQNMSFFMPVKGMVTGAYDVNSGHLGIDIAAKDGEPILATLAGTVILATWSSETGNVIQVQHSDNFISIYKHNSALLKKVGDKVVAGEPIAIIGNSGEFTTGTHLHFELWHNGAPVNPESYIAY